MTVIDVKECAIDRSRVVVHIGGPFKLLKTLYGSPCFMLARKPVPGRRKYYNTIAAIYCSLALHTAINYYFTEFPCCAAVATTVAARALFTSGTGYSLIELLTGRH